MSKLKSYLAKYGRQAVESWLPQAGPTLSCNVLYRHAQSHPCQHARTVALCAQVVIVGGVAGGASCAARLRRLTEAAEITIFERGPYVSFANCGLPYHVGGVIPVSTVNHFPCILSD